jgi:hypothetical protein
VTVNVNVVLVVPLCCETSLMVADGKGVVLPFVEPDLEHAAKSKIVERQVMATLILANRLYVLNVFFRINRRMTFCNVAIIRKMFIWMKVADFCSRWL